jgi:hypothetical protein
MSAENQGTETRAYETTPRELYSEVAVMSAAVILVYFFYENTRLMSVIMAALMIGRFALLNRKGDWLFFVIGVVVGGGNDVMSMYKEVYQYTPKSILPVPIPVWMVLFWGQIFVSFRKLMRFGPFRGPDQPPKRLIDAPLALDVLIAVAYRMIIYRTASEYWLPDALFAAILIARLLVFPPKDHERKLMLAMLVIGPLYEILLIGCGLYVYQTGVVFGMPLWLIIYWVFIIRVLKAIFDRVEYRVLQ